ncbi:MAG: glycosyltransferase [Snowella sp.]|nr:glycosyltransferase [Snowella sp.]
MLLILTIIASISLIIWLFLLLFWGQFWRADQRLDNLPKTLSDYPTVCAVIPARNEADVLPISLKSLLMQDYAGQFSIILIDDQSTDQTGEVAQAIAANLGLSEKLTVIPGQPLPPGWSGKLWAMEQGVQTVDKQNINPDYFLFTDADIKHHQSNLKELVSKAEQEQLALTSLMVLLRCESVWEQFLIPAFVFFFQKLYPFPWVNNPNRKMAAAAGGCILIRRDRLLEIGGIGSLREALIDDCTLAQKVKASQPSTAIWLGLTQDTKSLRPYDSLETIWNMIARTAYTQLNYSPWLLLGTLVGMSLVYLAAPIGLVLGIIWGSMPLSLISGLTWLLMAIAYLPTLKLYSLSPLWSLSLPLIALLYNLMTFDSALRHWRGQGGGWKGRVYPQS